MARLATQTGLGLTHAPQRETLSVEEGRAFLRATATCAACGMGFYASPGHLAKGWGKVCSMACRSKAQEGAGNARWTGEAGVCACGYCGKAFRVRPSHIAAGEGRHCSLACKRLAKSANRTCEHCHKAFSLYVSQRRKGQGRFCSMACLRAAKSPQWNRACASCGKWFYVKPGELLSGRKVNIGRFCSVKCKARDMAQRHHPAGGKRARSGKRADLDGRYFRSAWEANYARYLNWLIEHKQIHRWEFEVDTFEFPVKRGCIFYTPDFKVWATEARFEYHEIKGWMDQRSATKLKRMAKYYPTIKVLLIDAPQYRAIAKMASGFVPGWETT